MIIDGLLLSIKSEEMLILRRLVEVTGGGIEGKMRENREKSGLGLF